MFLFFLLPVFSRSVLGVYLLLCHWISISQTLNPWFLSQTEKHNLCLQIMFRLPNNICKFPGFCIPCAGWTSRKYWENFKKWVKLPINTKISTIFLKHYPNFYQLIICDEYCVAKIFRHFNPSSQVLSCYRNERGRLYPISTSNDNNPN